MVGLNKRIGASTLARTGLVILATAALLSLAWVVVVAGSEANSEHVHRASPRFAELGDVDANTTAAVNGGNLVEDEDGSVVVTAGVTLDHDFGELLVGEANDDNLVDISDFGVWKATFWSTADLRADFDLSRRVDIDDFGWIKKNFLKQGDGPLSTRASMPYAWETSSPIGQSQASTVTVYLDPPASSVAADEIFTVAIKIAAGMQQVDGAQAYVDFAPEHLMVTGISGGGVLPDEIYNSYSNTLGQADYAAGDISETVSGTFTLATITFQAVTETTGTPTELSFHTTSPRETRVILGETTLTSTLSGGEVVIVGSHYIYLPLVLRNYAQLQADFTASPTSGPAPLTVVFTNTSTGLYTDSWWDFGDGITSTQTSPTHTYTSRGTYTVALTVSKMTGTSVLPGDSSTLVRPNYIAVEERPAAPSHLQATPISCSQIELTWQDNSSNETGFTIYDGITMTHVGANTTSYTFGGLAPSTYRCFLVRAFNEYGSSGWNDDDNNGEPDWACTTTLSGTEMIVNGSFEDDGGWVIPDTPYPAAYTTAITRSGSRAMRAGIVESADNRYSYSSFRQTVTIPADVVSATLRFWLYPISGEPPVTPTFSARPLAATVEEAVLASDRQYVVVLNEYNEWINTLVWQRTNDQEWTPHEFDLSVYSGQTIKLQFGVYNDGWDGVTAMVVDDVSLLICDSTDQMWLGRGRLGSGVSNAYRTKLIELLEEGVK